MSAAYFSAHCAIRRENCYHIPKPSAYYKVVIMVELQALNVSYVVFYYKVVYSYWNNIVL